MAWFSAWVVLAATVVLFTLSLWHLMETASDLHTVRSLNAKTALLRQARGALILAGLRLVSSVFWFVFGVWAATAPTPPAIPIERYVLCVMVFMDIFKLSAERLTRYRINSSVDDERALVLAEALRVEHTLKQTADALAHRVEQKAEELAIRVEQKHDAVMAVLQTAATAIAENTKISTDALGAGERAYEEANHVNRKLEKLGLERNRLDEQRHDDDQQRHDDDHRKDEKAS